MTKAIAPKDLYLRIAGLLQAAKQNAVRAVNQTMVNTYYEIGQMIIEDEQQGRERAEYGKKVLKELSKKLTVNFGKGFSEDNLGRMKNFYLIYSKQISATTLRKSRNSSISNDYDSLKSPEDTAVSRFQLSWSHFLKLMLIDNQSERSFYEIECVVTKNTLKLIWCFITGYLSAL